MAYVIINMGSNMGDRRLNLSRAMRAIGSRFGDFELSHAIETPAQGFDSPHSFLNAAIMVRTDMEPHAVLAQLQEIEKQLGSGPHRNADGSYADRLIDLDIIAIDDAIIDTPTLQVPHPRLAERRFFLEPLQELAPTWRHPATGRTAAEMLAVLPADTDSQSEAK